VNYKELDTVDKIAKFVKEKVQTYIHYQEKKAIVIKELTPLFAHDVEGWKRVTSKSKFRNGFTRVLGKERMIALKELLCEIDKKYQKFDIGYEG
jgi:hypothetical protein